MKIVRMETVIASHLQNALDVFAWNKTAAALALDLDRRTVYRMIERYKLQPRERELPMMKCPCGFHGPVPDEFGASAACPSCGAEPAQ